MSEIVGGLFGGGPGGNDSGNVMSQLFNLPQIQLPAVPSASATPAATPIPVPQKITNESRYPMVDPMAGFAGTIATGGMGVTGPATVRRKSLLGGG